MSENLPLRRAIAEELLGSKLDESDCAICPGAIMHTQKSAKRDFRVFLSGAPNGQCFHGHCEAAVKAFNVSLQSRIGKAEAEGGQREPSMYGKTAMEPVAAPKTKRPPYQPEVLERLARKCPVEVSLDWLAERSPVHFPGRLGDQGPETARAFLSALYGPPEQVLVFTAQFTQGDYLFNPAKGCFRLGRQPGVAAVESELPTGAPEGVYFLVQPVDGNWHPNHNNKGRTGEPKLGRRHGDCVTAWRYLVLESDEAPEDWWLKALVQMPFPICAIYTSGGRSVHALVKVGCSSKAAFDALRDSMVQVLTPLGADAAAMTAVRLSRLPGMLRHGKKNKEGQLEKYPEPRLQRLLWLSPQAEAKPIINLVKH